MHKSARNQVGNRAVTVALSASLSFMPFFVSDARAMGPSGEALVKHLTAVKIAGEQCVPCHNGNLKAIKKLHKSAPKAVDEPCIECHTSAKKK